MQKTVVITGAGKDRVGIVAELTEFLFQQGCNILDSSMTLLRGEFALILMTTLPEAMTVEQLRSGLARLQERLALNFTVRELSGEELQESAEERYQFIISVYGADKPGIVAGITKELANLKLNITDVQTKSVKQDDGEIFVMMLELSSSEELSEKELKEKLASFASKMGVDLSVRELEVLEL
ncbi:MAG: ACT domain-containing protein [Candidatus Obscuribacterales bacterium]|nr:ACT domain-containing protein [Candidatus Obscuribacterales bacterium]